MIGVQQPRKHFRFTNVFFHDGQCVMYFKHDPATIGELYSREPGRVRPSEIAGKHWSSVGVPPGTPKAWVCALLDRSYELVLAQQSKAGRALLAEIAGEPNGFSHFHQLALSLHGRDDRVYLTYSDLAETPELCVDGRAIARFSWNRIRVKPEDAGLGWAEAGHWIELGPNRLADWQGTLEAAAQRALDAKGRP
jgi:predicted DNA-binding protein (MmcQ/YjbR family)